MLIYKIGITLISGIGDVNGKKLIAYCGSAEAVFKEKKNHLLKIPGIGESLANTITNQNILARAEQEIDFINKYKIIPIFYLDSIYPERLKHCIDSPMMLYYKGTANLNCKKAISIVGTRNATDYGKTVCKKLVEEFAGQDVLIVSGLAYGIDICAHKAALEYNLSTIAILAHGLDRVYPSAHKTVSEQMLINGGLLTDFISGTNPDRENFPQRNRIIAGMADATVVIESGKRSGALITAEIANSYNRDVFAVPGRKGDIYSEGCNHFIKTNKAALIESAEDIKYFMGWKDTTGQQIPKQLKLSINLTPEEKVLIDILKNNGESSIDWLCNQSQLNTSKVAAALLNLELEGIIKSLPGKQYRLT